MSTDVYLNDRYLGRVDDAQIFINSLKSERLKNKYTEEKLAEEIYNIANESKIQPKEFFRICYRLLINKDKGPRLASFILTIGKDKVIDLIKKIE